MLEYDIVTHRGTPLEFAAHLNLQAVIGWRVVSMQRHEDGQWNALLERETPASGTHPGVQASTNRFNAAGSTPV